MSANKGKPFVDTPSAKRDKLITEAVIKLRTLSKEELAEFLKTTPEQDAAARRFFHQRQVPDEN